MSVILKYLSVYLLSAFKFFFGPIAGVTFGMNIIITILLSILGMMTTVYVLTRFEKQIHHYFVKLITRNKTHRKFTKQNRRFVKIWRSFGLQGVALLTPVLFTPVGGALLLNAVGGNKKEIYKWMWISATTWGLMTFIIIQLLKSTLLPNIELSF